MLVVEGVWDLGFIVDLGWEGAREGGGSLWIVAGRYRQQRNPMRVMVRGGVTMAERKAAAVCVPSA
jgi:hypothetical protein